MQECAHMLVDASNNNHKKFTELTRALSEERTAHLKMILERGIISRNLK